MPETPPPSSPPRGLSELLRRWLGRGAHERELRVAIEERDRLRAELAAWQRGAEDAPQLFPPGHYHSPIPRLAEVRARAPELFDTGRRSFPAIDLREEQQLALLPVFGTYCAQQPWTDEPSPPRRYFFRNDFYSYADALSLYCWIRHARPLRLVEVGSGYSSCVSLDTNELFFGDSIACTFVEPYPERLRSLLRPGDEARVRIVEKPLQDVEPEIFQELGADDILFVDSTHVSRIGSDVHTLLFEILPALRPGVYVHFHDVFYPFEYPDVWVYQGRQWQEAYLLRAFLEFNDAFEIVFFNTMLWHLHRDALVRSMPLCVKNPGGSLWLRRR